MSAPKHTMDYENINDYSIQINRWFLISLGAWPQITASSRIKKIAVTIQIFILSIAVAVITIPCMLYICLEKEEITTKLIALVPLVGRTMGSINYWTLITRNKDIQRCIQHMETDWKLVRRNEDREVMLQYAKIGRFMTSFCAILMHSGSFFFTVVRSMKTTTVIIDNKTITMHPLTCPMYSKILDVRLSPANEIILGVQFLSMFVIVSASVSICSLAAVFAMHACGQLNVMHTWLNELAEEKKNHLAEQRLAAVVKHHWRALGFVEQIESIMHKVCLAEVMGCTMNMCLIGYHTVMNWGAFDRAKILYLSIGYISVGFNIFLLCYIGEVVTEQCKKIGEIAYMTNWYKLPRKTALGLILIIMQSSHVIKLTAGKLLLLSIATFGDIIKTSTAYLNILRTMTA